ncbi:MAG: glutathione S-transferase family protein [Pseudomonadota bacterium]
MAWQFYYAQHTIALASHIVLEEVGAKADLHRIDFGTAEQRSADYTALNPKARVPVLVTEHGTLTETPAMLVFIAQTFPQAGLAPSDPFAFAKMQEFNSYIASTLHVNHAHRMRGYRWSDDEAAHASMSAKVPETMAASFAHVEDWYLDGPYVLGDTYSTADAYLFTVAGWMKGDGVNPDDFPKVRDHYLMMKERPAVQRALEAQFAEMG